MKQKRHVCINCGDVMQLLFIYKGFDYYKCVNCRLVSTIPYPSDKQIKKHYADGFKNGNYKFLRDFSDQYRAVYKQLADILENSFEDKSFESKKILDVGCFTGDFLEILQQRGADVYGLELQPEAVKLANKKLPGRVKKVDLNNYKLTPSRFDAVSLLGVIEHVLDPPQLIRQCRSVLKKNGVIIIQTPNSSSFLAKALGKLWPPYSPVEHIHICGHRSMQKVLSESGFTKIKFKNHWKKLPVGYVYNMFNIFGPEFHKILKPIGKHISKSKIILSLYIGEMVVIAKRR